MALQGGYARYDGRWYEPWGAICVGDLLRTDTSIGPCKWVLVTDTRLVLGDVDIVRVEGIFVAGPLDVSGKIATGRKWWYETVPQACVETWCIFHRPD